MHFVQNLSITPLPAEELNNLMLRWGDWMICNFSII